MNSILQSRPEIHATVEISYTAERRAELDRVNQKHCSLLIALLKIVLRNKGAHNIEVWTPNEHGKERIADIVIEFTVNSKDDLPSIEQAVREKGGYSVGHVSMLT